jgi:UDP-N-acetylglucosamine diphosphorylase/glucosamine-1-phosphate N-acetyltransferase
MPNFILVDFKPTWEALKPFTFTRPICEIRVGILTIREKWEKYLKEAVSYQTEAYLQAKYPNQLSLKDNIFINSAICPNQTLVSEILVLKPNTTLKKEDTWIAYHNARTNNILESENHFTIIQNVWDIFAHNGAQIQADFALLTAGRKSQPIEDIHTIVYKPENVFLEEGVRLKACILDAEKGVIYLGKNAQVQPGAVIVGNTCIGEGTVVNIGAKLRGDNTIGAYCKVGGEISNTVFLGYSNKSHDGFLGNSVIGEWCNLGADTNTSNLKNNYSDVQIWHYPSQSFKGTGRQFCGLMMGDHSKASINTMFNTGTVVGVSANIFGGGFPPKHIPSFSWGGSEGIDTYQFEKACEVAQRVMERREKALDEVEQSILKAVFEMDKP